MNIRVAPALLVPFLLAALPQDPQPATNVILGQVVDAGSAKPIGDAIVGIASRSRQVLTSADGYFVFRNVPALPPIEIDGNQRFKIDGLQPGIYKFRTRLRGIRTPIGSWWLKSMVVNGADLLDAPLELKQSATDAVVTFTQRTTELSGSVTSKNGQAAAQTLVSRSAWSAGSGSSSLGGSPAFVRDVNGRYSIKNLPPGEYFVTTDNSLGHNECFDPAVLDRLTVDSVRISIADVESTQVDVVAR